MGGISFRRFVPIAAMVTASLGLASPSAWAQPKGDKGGGQDDKDPKDQEWTELQVEEDEPETETEPPPPPPPPPGAGGSQYRPAAPPPKPKKSPPKTKRSEDDEEGESRTYMRYWEPQFAWRSIRAEFDVFSTNEFNCYTWDVVARLGVEDFPAYFDVDIPWTFRAPNGPDQLQFGNPTFGGHGGGTIAGVVGLWGGATVSVPTTYYDADNVAEQRREWAALNTASVARAKVDAHRFFPLFVPVRMQLGVEVQIHPFVYGRAEFVSALYIPTKDVDELTGSTGYGYAAFFSTMDQIYEVEALSPIGLGGGVRFQVWMEMAADVAVGTGRDLAQTALEPYIAYSPPFRGPFETPVFARVGLLFALDEPHGFGFEDNQLPTPSNPLVQPIYKVATLRTMVGARY